MALNFAMNTFHRDTLLWVKAVDSMRRLKPEILVPQHTRPLEGSEVIMETLTAYRDAIQFVHDQTVRYMNKGKSPLVNSGARSVNLDITMLN